MEAFNRQPTWTLLTLGFKTLLIIFEEALHEDLSEYQLTYPQIMMLQYVDDILIVTSILETYQKTTRVLLQELNKFGN